MNLEEAKKVAAIVATAEGGCGGCCEQATADLNKQFPTFAWKVVEVPGFDHSIDVHAKQEPRTEPAGAGAARPVLWVPRAKVDSEHTVAGELRVDECEETEFQMSDPDVWECLPLYAKPEGQPLPAGAGAERQDQQNAREVQIRATLAQAESGGTIMCGGAYLPSDEPEQIGDPDGDRDLGDLGEVR